MNGQWIEVGGIPYFCPDNSPDLDELEQADEAQESESNCNSEYDEF